MFKFTGTRPRDLGVTNGRFGAAATWKPNWVSSQVDAGDKHHIAPLKAGGDAKAAMQRLAKVVESSPRAKVVDRKDGYLYAEFSTPLMGFTDDVECTAAGDVIHVRSSSRLGIRDLGVNRNRIEAIRRRFEKG
jgi:uncharacterized protein (DUF1499 family)